MTQNKWQFTIYDICNCKSLDWYQAAHLVKLSSLRPSCTNASTLLKTWGQTVNALCRWNLSSCTGLAYACSQESALPSAFSLKTLSFWKSEMRNWYSVESTHLPRQKIDFHGFTMLHASHNMKADILADFSILCRIAVGVVLFCFWNDYCSPGEYWRTCSCTNTWAYGVTNPFHAWLHHSHS